MTFYEVIQIGVETFLSLLIEQLNSSVSIFL